MEPAEAERALDAVAPDVRAEVARLLDHDRRAGPEFLAPHAGLLAEVARATAPEPPERRLGAQIGRYTATRVLGQGGMGVVYAAHDPVLDREVALKVLRRGAPASEWLRHEALALARLAHPNVVAVHEVGDHDGQLYLAMERIEGPTLRQWLEAPRSVTERLRVILDAARGLEAAHQRGLVHRDFKPDNILVGADGRARVVDFAGAPRVADPDRGASGPEREPLVDVAASSPGAAPLIAGTPGYIAPEALNGGLCTTASDQWSFGVTLAEAMWRHTRVDPSRPAELPRVSDLPAWLFPIARRCLAADPGGRYPTMTALIAAIEAHLPELDGLEVGRQRRRVGYLFIAFTSATGAALLTATGREWLDLPWVRVSLPLSFAGGGALLTLLRWREATATNYGRRLAALPVLSGLLLAASHGLAMSHGLSLAQSCAVDLLLAALGLGLVAALHEPWMGWLGALAFTGVVASALAPRSSPEILGALAFGCAVGMSVRLWLDRHQNREAERLAQLASRPPP